MVSNVSKCPVCGSTECVHSDGIPDSLIGLKCPMCYGTKFVVGMVRERSGELAVVDWMCRHCDYKWSDSYVLPVEFVPKMVFWFRER